MDDSDGTGDGEGGKGIWVMGTPMDGGGEDTAAVVTAMVGDIGAAAGSGGVENPLSAPLPRRCEQGEAAIARKPIGQERLLLAGGLRALDSRQAHDEVAHLALQAIDGCRQHIEGLSGGHG